MNELENKILEFIDKETWSEDKPKLNKDGYRIKARWNRIQFIEKNKYRFDGSRIEFENVIYNLKVKKMITSRTKCQHYAGLVTTKLGHNTILNS